MFEQDRTETAAAVARVLEEAAYLISEPVSDRVPRWTTRSLLQASLRMSRDGGGDAAVLGTFMLACSGRLAVEIAANMMGIEPTAEQAVGSAEDALGEVLNIVAGVLCEQWFADDPGIEVGIPQVEVTSDRLVEEWASSGQSTLCLRTDDGDWLLAGFLSEAVA